MCDDSQEWYLPQEVASPPGLPHKLLNQHNVGIKQDRHAARSALSLAARLATSAGRASHPVVDMRGGCEPQPCRFLELCRVDLGQAFRTCALRHAARLCCLADCCSSTGLTGALRVHPRGPNLTNHSCSSHLRHLRVKDLVGVASPEHSSPAIGGDIGTRNWAVPSGSW